MKLSRIEREELEKYITENHFDEALKGKTILITSHILSFIEELSDEILFILEGNIYFRGTPGQLLETTQRDNFQEAIAELLKNEKYD